MGETLVRETLVQKKKDASYIVKSLIGIAIMIFFQFIPAPAPVTQAGMAVLGQFLGLIFLWTLVDMVWPTMFAIVMFGFHAFAIYPNSFQMHGIYEAGTQSFGNWIVIFVIGCLLLCVALQEVGSIRRLALWFVSRKFARKNPWTFTFMLLLSALVISLFLDVLPAQFFMLGVAHEMFCLFGFKKGEHWPKIIVVGITFTVILGFAMTPICHPLPILFMGIFSAISGTPVNFLSYMLLGIPLGFIIWIIMFLWFRFVVKPDMSKFENVDFSVIEDKRPGPMDKREKTVVVVSLLVVLAWLLPGFMSFLAPNSAFYAFMNELTGTAPLLLGIVALCIIRFEGKPLLNLADAFSKIAWVPVLLLAGIMMVASALGEETTGIPAFIATYVVPLADGMSPFAIVAIIGILSCVITNIANNVPAGIIFISVGTPMAMAAGINPILVAMAVSIGANLAYTIPPAYAPIGVAYADEYGGAGVTLRNGLFMTVVSCAVIGLLLYPLGVLIFGS